MKIKELKINRKDHVYRKPRMGGVWGTVWRTGWGGTEGLLRHILHWMRDTLNATIGKRSQGFPLGISGRVFMRINLHPSHRSKTGQHLKFLSHFLSAQTFSLQLFEKDEVPTHCWLPLAAASRARWKTHSSATPPTPPPPPSPPSSSIQGHSDVPTMRCLLGEKKTHSGEIYTLYVLD